MKLRELHDLVGNSTLPGDAEVELKDGELVETDAYEYPDSPEPEADQQVGGGTVTLPGRVDESDDTTVDSDKEAESEE